VDEAAFASALECRAPLGWMHDVQQEADPVERGLGARFLRLPEHDSRDGYTGL
jgi:hypothetical protein